MAKNELVTLTQKLVAKREAGVELSTQTTQYEAIKALKPVSKFTNKSVWKGSVVR